MSSSADPAIAALRAVHDGLVARVEGYADPDLTRPSAASEWTVAQVLSHTGSGAEIGRAGLEAAVAGSPPPEQAFYQSVWDRWDAMTPRGQADGVVTSDTALVEAYEALDDETRSTVQGRLPFLPAPVGVDLLATLRLNESALHAWDVAVVDDAAAGVEPAAVPVLLDALSGPLGVLVGFLGKPPATPAVLAVRTSDPVRELTLTLGASTALTPGVPDAPDGELSLPGEALLRLLTGRLAPEHTPAAVVLTGPLDLDALRTAFPGF